MMGSTYLFGNKKYLYQIFQFKSIILVRPSSSTISTRDFNTKSARSIFNNNNKINNGNEQIIANEGLLFQSSDFKSLSLSEHGSLIQEDERINTLKKNNFPIMGYMMEEEELNLDHNYNESLDNQFPNRRKVNVRNSIRSSMRKNPNESPQFHMIRNSHDFKITSSSITEFYSKIINTENSIQDYNFELPKFPKDLNALTLKQYLIDVNSIDFSYDSKGYEDIVFYQIRGLIENITKLEGLLNIDIMHEFIKFFSNYSMTNTIFKIINDFEKNGVNPNRDTLHLLILKLSNISNLNSRKDLLKFYIFMGIKKWKISTDLLTQFLIYYIQKPSKKRLSIAKMLSNEGLHTNFLKYPMYEDYISIELDKDNKSNFEKITKKLLRLKLIDGDTDKIKLFRIYIKILTQKNRIGNALKEIEKYDKQYNTTECWEIIMNKLVKNREIWNCFAIINILKSDTKIDLRKIIFILLHDYRIMYEFFTKQKFKQTNTNLIFCYIIKLLQKLSESDFKPAMEFISRIKPNDDIINDEIENKIELEFEKVQIWRYGINDENYDRFFTDTENVNNEVDFIKRLWDVYDIEGGRQTIGMISVNPIIFPWK